MQVHCEVHQSSTYDKEGKDVSFRCGGNTCLLDCRKMPEILVMFHMILILLTGLRNKHMLLSVILKRVSWGLVVVEDIVTLPLRMMDSKRVSSSAAFTKVWTSANIIDLNIAVLNMDYVNRYEERTLWGEGKDLQGKWGAAKVHLRARPPGDYLCWPMLL